MVMVLLLLMEKLLYMLDNGKMDLDMDKARSILQVALTIKDNLLMETNKDLERWFILAKIFMKGILN